MEREKEYNVEDLSPELMDELEAMQQEQAEDMGEDQFLSNQELQEAYGYPQAEEKQNAHSFLHKAAFGNPDTVRTTFLSESELGKPLFNVRFLMDMEDISRYYIDPLVKDLKLPLTENKIAVYFFEKLQNIAGSGMSNKGFAMNLNVTRRMDATRRRLKPPTPTQGKGGGSQ